MAEGAQSGGSVTLLDRLRAPLYVDRTCPTCGHAFRAKSVAAVYCTRACQMRAWRAAKMLEGTHGWVNRQFARVVE